MSSLSLLFLSRIITHINLNRSIKDDDTASRSLSVSPCHHNNIIPSLCCFEALESGIQTHGCLKMLMKILRNAAKEIFNHKHNRSLLWRFGSFSLRCVRHLVFFDTLTFFVFTSLMSFIFIISEGLSVRLPAPSSGETSVSHLPITWSFWMFHWRSGRRSR